MEETITGSKQPPVLNRQSIERLFQYIRQSLEEEDMEMTEGEAETEILQPVEEPDVSGTHRESIAVYTEEGETFAEFSRDIRLDYEIQDEAADLGPKTLHLKNIETASSGMPGFHWVEQKTVPDFQEDSGDIVIYTDGIWEVHFLYQEEEVYFEVEDRWHVQFSPDDLISQQQ